MKFDLDERVLVNDEPSVYHQQIGKVLARREINGVVKYVLEFNGGDFTGDFVEQQLEKLEPLKAPVNKEDRPTTGKPVDYRKVTRQNIADVARWCDARVIEPFSENPRLSLATGFTENSRLNVLIGDVIEKRDDGKYKVWVNGQNVERDELGDEPFVPEDRPYMKQDREFSPLAEAVAFVNVGFYEDELPTEDVYVVWFCSTIQNWKALVSTNVKDNAYYEVTHNGEKNETYVDRYVKTQQMKVDRNIDKATITKIDNFDF